jgi:hypothetical protein
LTGSDSRPLLDDRGLLARLIGFDTTSRTSNLPLADFLSNYLERRDVRILRNPSADGTDADERYVGRGTAGILDGLIRQSCFEA